MSGSSTKTRVSIDFDVCDNNQACVDVCPTGVFEVVNGRAVVKNQTACELCLKCIDSCPEGAIEVDY